MFSMYGCRNDEIRGVFVARFTDDTGSFIKRITLPSLAEPELRLRLSSKKYICELRVFVPSELPVEVSQCDRISGSGTVLCSDAREIPVAWKMTSCHSGFGRSLEGSIEHPFLFGFSGNASNAQDQLDLAREARFFPPEDAEVSPADLSEHETSQVETGGSPWTLPNSIQ